MVAILNKNVGLYTDFYELTMAQGYFLNGSHNTKANFDYFFRKTPFGGGYVVFAGISDLLSILEGLTFDGEDIDYLQSQNFNKDFLEYLKTFQFKGSIHAAREGEVVFPGEPILRVEGNIIETQLVETLVLNILNFQSLIATKAARIRQSAGDRKVIEFGLRRAQGLGGIWASKAAIIGGADSTSNVYSALKYGLKAVGTQAHSWIESFDDELAAFRAFVKAFAENSILLVDTYDTLHSGIPNAIIVAKEMEQEGKRLKGIRLDSGDLAYLSKKARNILDEVGLSYVQIVASNQLDEHVIKSLIDQGAPLDAFGVGTQLAIGGGDGALDGVYKLSMYNNEPKLKISENVSKTILPGVKKVYRYLDSENNFLADGILLTEETEVPTIYHPYFAEKHFSVVDIQKEVLLNPVITQGEAVAHVQEKPEKIAVYARARLAQLPDEYKRFENPHTYKVGVSGELKELRSKLIRNIKEKFSHNKI